MEALGRLLAAPVWEGHAGRLGFENAGGCLPPEGGSAPGRQASRKGLLESAPVTFLPGPLKTPSKKDGGGLSPAARSGQTFVTPKGQWSHCFDLLFT